MAKLTLTDVTTGYSSATRINANNDLIEAALENTLSRDGTSPNTMSANLDMNSNRVINLAAPQNDNDAARRVDLTAITSGTYGTDNEFSGQNTFSAQQTFTASGHITPAVNLSSAAPALHVTESDQSANNKIWYLQGQGGLFQLGVLNDAKDTSSNWCQVTRSGVTISSVAFPTATADSLFIGTSSSVVSPSVVHVLAPGSTHGQVTKVTSDAVYSHICWNTDTSGDNGFAYFATEGTITGRGSITYNRGGGLVAYNTTSDRRLKTNITDAPDAGTVVDSLRVRSFDWIDGPHVDYWLVAQEVYDVLPLAVTKGDDGEAVERQWSVDPSKLVPLLLKAIQELRARVAVLEQA